MLKHLTWVESWWFRRVLHGLPELAWVRAGVPPEPQWEGNSPKDATMERQGGRIREVGAARALVFTYINPVVALAAGVIVLNEPLTVWNVAALALILVGCVLATRRHEGTPDIAAEPTSVAPR